MADSKQINATVPNATITEVDKQPERSRLSFSKVVGILLDEALEARKKKNGNPKNKK